jgi:large subunit ribosomal protein L22
MEVKAIHRGARLSAQKRAWWLTRSAASRSTGAEHPDLLAEEGGWHRQEGCESAIANAEHNDGADIDELKVKSIYVDKADAEAFHRARQGPRQPHREADLPHHVTVGN